MYENFYLCHNMTDPGNKVVSDESRMAACGVTGMYKSSYLYHSMRDPGNSVVTDESRMAGMWSDRYLRELLPMPQYDRPW